MPEDAAGLESQPPWGQWCAGVVWAGVVVVVRVVAVVVVCVVVVAGAGELPIAASAARPPVTSAPHAASARMNRVALIVTSLLSARTGKQPGAGREV